MSHIAKYTKCNPLIYGIVMLACLSFFLKVSSSSSCPLSMKQINQLKILTIEFMSSEEGEEDLDGITIQLSQLNLYLGEQQRLTVF